ncbi:ABC-three component system middle component 5 [Bacteroides graminisolvens]|uniref:ABC-three component system middle component 5 n=1 Tax=Bacteroides graminisolvens TaxID=477666 RepID=UPI003211D07C
MIVYHPVYDTYHCLTRTLKILRCLGEKSYEKDRIKIYDYYFLFPCETGNITLPGQFSTYKKICKANRYNKVYDIRNTFSQLESVQETAYRALASFGFIENNLLFDDIIKLTNNPIPENLLFDLTDEETSYMELVTTFFENISISELKKRTKLMEYRYEFFETK